MLALKLFLVPSFLIIVTLAGKRWGPGVAGWLAGLPVSAGPILFVVTLEQGTRFAQSAAAASLSAVSTTIAFCAIYSHSCQRFRWSYSLLITASLWLAAISLLAHLPTAPGIALALAATALLLAPRLFPAQQPIAISRSIAVSELACRAAAGAALTLAVTLSAASIGMTWSGLLTTYPVLGTVLAIFSHRQHGPHYVVSLLRSMAIGMYSFAAFFLTLSLFLDRLGTMAAFCAASTAALLTQLVTSRFHFSRRKPT